ncbi:MAG: prepilin-type N-terminal cleavage/methylation domain-containing protein [Phycisphaeraceae bacterium]
MNPRPHQRAGFTLIELLVVVSIVGLLIALLLPALGSARASVRATMCLSNQRQTAAALINYTAEHRGRFVYYATTAPATPGKQWWFGYQSDNSTAMNRPLDKTRGPLASYLGDTIDAALACSDFPADDDNFRAKFAVRSAHFGINGAIVPPFENVEPRLIDEVKQPSDVFAFADAVHQQVAPVFFEPHSVSYRRPGKVTGTAHYRHDNRANLAYLDGHAEPLAPPPNETVWQTLADAPLTNLDSSDGIDTRYGFDTWTK